MDNLSDWMDSIIAGNKKLQKNITRVETQNTNLENKNNELKNENEKLKKETKTQKKKIQNLISNQKSKINESINKYLEQHIYMHCNEETVKNFVYVILYKFYLLNTL